MDKFQKLDQSMDNDFVSNYFKPVAKGNILDKYNADRHKNQGFCFTIYMLEHGFNNYETMILDKSRRK